MGPRSGGVSFGRRVAELAARHGGVPAITAVAASGSARSLTWRQLDDRSSHLAAGFRTRGVGVGDCIAVCLPTCLEHLVACVAAWKSGAVPVAVRWDLPEWELDRVLGAFEPRLVLRGDPAAVVAEVVGRGGPEGSPVVRDSPPDARSVPDVMPVPDAVSPHRFGVCSSGSTGIPKVVLHASPAVYRPAMRSTSAVVEAYRDLSVPQVLLVPNALYHSSSITTASINLVSGNHTILLERFTPELLVETVERRHVTGFMAPTPILLRLARLANLDSRSFASVEWVQHGAAPLPEWLARFWIDLLGPERFFTSYGSAEAVGVVACRGDEWLTHPGTLGRGVLGTDVVVLDDQGRQAAPHDIGAIHLRRPGGPAGAYLGRGVPPLDVRDDGFATVGDLGWLDEDGFLFLADRRVDLIVTGGANVYPAEVEAAVSEHPAVADVVVVGLPDDEWGHRVHAIVQLERDGVLTAEDVRAFARSRLAPYKVPKTVELVDQIPRSAAMKVNRAALTEERSRAVG